MISLGVRPHFAEYVRALKVNRSVTHSPLQARPWGCVEDCLGGFVVSRPVVVVEATLPRGMLVERLCTGC